VRVGLLKLKPKHYKTSIATRAQPAACPAGPHGAVVQGGYGYVGLTRYIHNPIYTYIYTYTYEGD